MRTDLRFLRKTSCHRCNVSKLTVCVHACRKRHNRHYCTLSSLHGNFVQILCISDYCTYKPHYVAVALMSSRKTDRNNNQDHDDDESNHNSCIRWLLMQMLVMMMMMMMMMYVVHILSFFVFERLRHLYSTDEKSFIFYQKAELSQRWPRDAPYVWVPWKFSGVPDDAHGYFSRNFNGLCSNWAHKCACMQNLKFER